DLESELASVRPDSLSGGGGLLRSVGGPHPILLLVPRLLVPGVVPRSPI
ncbi:hypothetical protein LINGRAHAP2_LOCUS34705, partial [Linum grandiflorum]